ncbi:MAG TPA: ferritin family protein [Polyangiaceae bacterium]|nr:ferritin family protein [Polyangiaceae bacterium]
MDNVELFLAHAVQLERDAARRFEDLMHSMHSAGNYEVEALFRRLGEFSRLHLKAATARSGFQSLPALQPHEFQWPEGTSPEAARWRGVDGALDVLSALELALEGEECGMRFYEATATSSGNPEVVRMAREFASEEADHVSELQRWIQRATTGQTAPQKHY